MKTWNRGSIWTLAVGLLLAGSPPLAAQDFNMNFFVVVDGPQRGADLGAVFVADGHCESLGYEAGWGDVTWRAYITGTAADGEADQVARDRIGAGPWYNYAGVMVAETVADLHSDSNNLNRGTALTLTGQTVPESVLEIPSGSQLDGRAFSREGPFFCFGVR